MYEIITAGGVVGEMALIDEGAPRNASILAATYAELWEINTDKLRSMVTGNPDFALMIMRDGAASPDHEPALSPHSACLPWEENLSRCRCFGSANLCISRPTLPRP